MTLIRRTAMNNQGNPDRKSGITRRDALRLGVCGAAGLLAAGSIGRAFAADAPETRPTTGPATKPAIRPKAKSVIQVFLWGGMSHNDTWDPKPDSGYDYMGEFAKAIPTNVPGIEIG